MDNKDDFISEPINLEKENLIPPKEKESDVRSLSMRDIRSLAFHLIYAMEQFDYDVSLESIVETFRSGFDLDIPDDSKAIEIARNVIEKRKELDELLLPLLQNWNINRLGTCTLLILRMALWELAYTNTPPTIVINEAIELAKSFAEKDAYKFINGVLDKFVNKEK